jgi:hypothetical protein
MEMKNKHIFWEALILAIFIFASGILLGYMLEMNRTSKIISLYQQAELDTLDTRIQDNIISLTRVDCNLLFNETINFANRIYGEASLLEKYEGANQLSEGIVFQHKKYDLLRAELWLNSIKIKEKCPVNLSTIVYFYEYNPDNLKIKSEQDVYSKKLFELKTSTSNIILIPIAGNMNISSIDYLKSYYNITKYPAVVVNEKIVINTLEDLDKIESYLN